MSADVPVQLYFTVLCCLGFVEAKPVWRQRWTLMVRCKAWSAQFVTSCTKILEFFHVDTPAALPALKPGDAADDCSDSH